MELLIAISVGLALSMAIWNVYKIITSVPLEDRSYMDRPPKGFRMVWPLIRFLVHYTAPYLSRNFRLKIHTRLRRAGVDYSLSPEQFFAGKLISAAGFIGFTALLQSMLDMSSFLFLALAGFGGFLYPEQWLREQLAKRQKQIFRSLPFYLDVITLCVEAGSNLSGAFTQSVKKAEDGPLKAEINRVLRDVRAGKQRSESMRAMADRLNMPSINSLVSSLIQAEKLGSNLGQVLRSQSDQRRTERFQKAEKLGMEAPVKLLGPLVMFIFPTTFLVIAFVILVKAVHSGVISWEPLIWALTWPGV
jgi:tight adherence protein C